MPVIRRKLEPATVYPEDIRYDPDTDAVQRLINGDWVDAPDSDPRAATTLPARVTAHPACDAAQSVVDALQAQIDGIIEAIDNTLTAFQIAGLVLGLFSFGVFEIFISIALAVAHGMIDAGSTALNAALTAPVYHTLVCIIRCHMMPNGRLEPGSLGDIETNVNDQIGGLAATTLNAMLSLAGEGGINNLAALGTSTGDCSDCGCETPLCENEEGFEYGDVSSVTIDPDIGTTTYVVSSVAVSGTNAVRWGFLATSAPIGCIISVYGASPSSDTNIYFRLEGEGDGTYHGPTGIGAVPIGDGGSCFNMFQQNEDFPFVATFVFKHC